MLYKPEKKKKKKKENYEEHRIARLRSFSLGMMSVRDHVEISDFGVLTSLSNV